MKTRILTLIACLFLIKGAEAQTVIHYWDFDRLIPYSGPVNADSLRNVYPDSAMVPGGLMIYRALTTAPAGYSTYFDTVGGTPVNVQVALGAAPGGGKALDLHNPSAQMEARFYVPCGGYKDVIFSFGGKTNNGATRMNFTCSLDSGLTWTSNGVVVTSAYGFGNGDSLSSLYTLHTVKFDTTLTNNNNKFVVRITFANGTSATTNGGMALDNVTLVGTLMPKAGVNSLSGSKAIEVYPDPATTSIHMQTTGMGTRSVTIYNVAGKVMRRLVMNTQLMNVPVAELIPGLYYVVVHEEETGANYNGKFVKE